MTTPTTLSRVLNPLGTLLIAAAAAVLLVPAASAHIQLQGFVLQLLGAVTLLGFALVSLVAASNLTQQVHATAPKATAGNAARTSAHSAGVVAAAA